MLLGTGNVASHLFQAFSETEDTQVVQVYGRNQKALSPFANFTNTTHQINKLIDADAYIIAIADDAIAGFSNQLPLHNKLVVHTSGSIAMNALSNQNRKGVFYPLQSFTKGKKMDYSSVPFCIEAEAKNDEKLLLLLANHISKKVQLVNSDQRKHLHVAAVFVNNFVNHLYTIGEDICTNNKVSFDLLKPLIQETATKIMDLSPTDSQTGPAKRNDKQVIASHLSMLENKNQQDIYTILTQSITKKYGNQL